MDGRILIIFLFGPVFIFFVIFIFIDVIDGGFDNMAGIHLNKIADVICINHLVFLNIL